MKSNIKYLLLTGTGVTAGLILLEAALLLFWGKPPALKKDRNLIRTYVDVYSPLFVRNGETYSRRQIYCGWRIYKTGTFTGEKQENEKRVFILGESVSYLFDDDDLENRLAQRNPGYKWNVINAGVIGYDSYRISLVFDEILRYSPDGIILLMGNNEGCYDPVKINHWIYEYWGLDTFWITRIITGIMNPPITKKGAEVNRYFESNLRKMIKTCEKKDIPIFLVTLPNNHMMPLSYGKYSDVDFFTGWWLLDKRPRKALEVFRQMAEASVDTKELYNWYMFKASQNLDSPDMADRYITSNRDPARFERNDIIRSLSAESNLTILVDFDRTIMSISGGKPGFDFFKSAFHFWPAVYRLLYIELAAAARAYFNETAEPGDLTGTLSYAADYIAGLGKNSDFAMKEELFNVLVDKTGGQNFEKEKSYLEFMRELYPEWFEGSVKRSVSQSREPSTASGLCKLGEVLRENNDFNKAEICFDRAAETNPELPLVYFFRGLCRYDRGEQGPAEKDFSSLKRLDPAFGWINTAYLDSLLDESRGRK
ncbi:MAG: hypothetical protein JXJ19_06595 [Elusimicrobia bacterium]|nr:hypothetical protein [Elusimicrobiota bacterium]